MQPGDVLYFNGIDDLWTEPTKGSKPREGLNRHWVGTIVEPADDLADAVVDLQPAFELGECTRLTVGEILDEISNQPDEIQAFNADADEINIVTHVR